MYGSVAYSKLTKVAQQMYNSKRTNFGTAGAREAVDLGYVAAVISAALEPDTVTTTLHYNYIFKEGNEQSIIIHKAHTCALPWNRNIVIII